MRYIYLLVFFFSLHLSLYAQKVVFLGGEQDAPRKMDPCDTLDYTYLNVHY